MKRAISLLLLLVVASSAGFATSRTKVLTDLHNRAEALLKDPPTNTGSTSRQSAHTASNPNSRLPDLESVAPDEALAWADAGNHETVIAAFFGGSPSPVQRATVHELLQSGNPLQKYAILIVAAYTASEEGDLASYPIRELTSPSLDLRLHELALHHLIEQHPEHTLPLLLAVPDHHVRHYLITSFALKLTRMNGTPASLGSRPVEDLLSPLPPAQRAEIEAAILSVTRYHSPKQADSTGEISVH